MNFIFYQKLYGLHYICEYFLCDIKDDYEDLVNPCEYVILLNAIDKINIIATVQI